jgi:hypothetical protein
MNLLIFSLASSSDQNSSQTSNTLLIQLFIGLISFISHEELLIIKSHQLISIISTLFKSSIDDGFNQSK